MISLDTLLDLLERYKYLAMFGVLFACGLGLPMPEEVTLIASGLAVGWEKAEFFWASVACVLGILAGDAFIFAMGRYYGRRFLSSRPMRLVLSEKREARIHRLFARHGNKAVFFARFLAGVRIGVYAYAGQHGMGWIRFLFLDFLGALLSGPTSIWLGSYAARKLADPQEAADWAKAKLHEGSYFIYGIVALLVLLGVGHWWLSHRGESRKRLARSLADPTPAAPSRPGLEEAGVSTIPGVVRTRDPEAPEGAGPR